MGLHALLIPGSSRADSRTTALARILSDRLRQLGVTTALWDFGAKPLPMMDPYLRDHPEFISDTHLNEFRREASLSDALVLCSPVYHDSYSGLIKNALDHLSTRDLTGKAFGLASHGGRRTTQAVSHLRTVVRSFNCTAIPTQICTEDSDFLFDDSDRPCGLIPPIEERVVRLCDELSTFALVHHHLRRGTLLTALSASLDSTARMANIDD
jgi:NAD(P)H-dependent FMN reductase